MAVLKGQLLAAALLGVLGQTYGTRIQCEALEPTAKSVYDFTATTIYQNQTIDFSVYKGTVLAIVNVVSPFFLSLRQRLYPKAKTFVSNGFKFNYYLQHICLVIIHKIFH